MRWRSRGNSCGTGRERPRVQSPRRGRHRTPTCGGGPGGGHQPSGDLSACHHASRRRPGRDGVGPVTTPIVEVARANPTDGTRMVAALAVEGARRGGEPQASPTGHASPQAPPAHPWERSAAAAGVLPGHPARRAVAHGHDQGVDRGARLGLPARHRRLLHPRDRRLDGRRPHSQRRGHRLCRRCALSAER